MRDKREAAAEARARRVMILEDDEATAELIRFYLQEEGYETAVALIGKDFARKVAAYRPDLITIDVILPDVSGFSVFKTLQENEATRDIPIVFITVRESTKEQGLAMGAAGYVVKPFSEGDLKATIRSALGAAQQP